MLFWVYLDTTVKLPGTASNMLRQSMVVETKRREAVETSDTVAVLDIPRIKEVFKSGDIVEAAYLLQVSGSLLYCIKYT